VKVPRACFSYERPFFPLLRRLSAHHLWKHLPSCNNFFVASHQHNPRGPRSLLQFTRDILCPVPMPSFLFGSAVNVCCDLGYFYLSTYPDCLWLTPSHVLHLLFFLPSIVCP